jgi:surfactin family lipopeptide synthetase A
VVLICDLSEVTLLNEFQEVPIGQPISNVEVYILDTNLQPCPVGVAGELYIGGVCLARGYLNRPDLTAEKFISNPFSSHKEARLYKTGDKVRYLPDSNIEFLGRIDNQVKVRGFRIELDEVEAAILQHPDVQQAVVICREDTPGDKRLVAYFIAKQQQFTITQLRSFLQSKLPNYMMPRAFMMLDALPLTPSGKVDRRALFALDMNNSQLVALSNDFIAPSTLTETILAAIWAEVLGLRQVGIKDNFIELGGHSLLAAQIVSSICDRLEVELRVNSLFEAPTVAELALIVESEQKQQHLDKAKPIVRIDRSQPIPLSFCQEQLWFIAQLYPNAPVYNESLTIYLGRDINTSALEQSLTEMIHRHEILRTTFNLVDGKPVQVIHPPSGFTLPIVDLRSHRETKREAQVLQLATELLVQPMDLTSGPLLRPTLILVSDADTRLYIAVHHILVDGYR